MTEPKPTYTAITPEAEVEMTNIERAFLTRWRQFAPDGLPLMVAQFYYARPIGRELCADFAFPDARLLIEGQGGVFTGQAHGSISGILKDNDRLNTAALLGWRMMRFTSKDLDEQPEQLVGQIVAALGVTQ